MVSDMPCRYVWHVWNCIRHALCLACLKLYQTCFMSGMSEVVSDMLYVWHVWSGIRHALCLACLKWYQCSTIRPSEIISKLISVDWRQKSKNTNNLMHFHYFLVNPEVAGSSPALVKLSLFIKIYDLLLFIWKINFNKLCYVEKYKMYKLCIHIHTLLPGWKSPWCSKGVNKSHGMSHA